MYVHVYNDVNVLLCAFIQMNKSIYIPVLLLVGVLCSTFIVISVVDTNSTIRGFFVAKDNNNVYEQVGLNCIFNNLR